MRNPEFEIDNFSYAIELLQEFAPWDLDMSRTDTNNLKGVLKRTANLLKDIELNPDRKYTVAEIMRLQTAIEWALGGGR